MASHDGCGWVRDANRMQCCLCGSNDRVAVCKYCHHQLCARHRRLGWANVKAALGMSRLLCSPMSARYAAGGY